MQSLHQSFTYKTSSSCHWHSHLICLQQPTKSQQNLQGTKLIQYDKLTKPNMTIKPYHIYGPWNIVVSKSWETKKVAFKLTEQTFWDCAAPQKTLNLLVSLT